MSDIPGLKQICFYFIGLKTLAPPLLLGEASPGESLNKFGEQFLDILESLPPYICVQTWRLRNHFC